MNGDAGFPPYLTNDASAFVFLLLPDNWNGTDKVIVWLKGDAAAQIGVTVNCYAGTCNEDQQTHSDTNNAYTPTLAISTYYCIDITADIAAFIAALTARDMIEIEIYNSTVQAFKAVGVEIQET